MPTESFRVRPLLHRSRREADVAQHADYFRVYLDDPRCAHIVLGVAHDKSYVGMLNEAACEGGLERVHLLRYGPKVPSAIYEGALLRSTRELCMGSDRGRLTCPGKSAPLFSARGRELTASASQANVSHASTTLFRRRLVERAVVDAAFDVYFYAVSVRQGCAVRSEEASAER